MHASLLLTTLSALAPLAAAEQVLGVYIFHRHGDRTTKAWKPVNLTSLGADEVFSSGDFFRRRYLSGSGSDSGVASIKGLSRDTAVLSQLAVTAPVDAVLHNSALTFLQGLYPPTDDARQKLANGTTVNAPLGGYQYIPVAGVQDAATSNNAENSEWLQGGSGCTKAVSSSNSYLSSSDFKKDLDASQSFYQSLLPAINTTFSKENATFQDAYLSMSRLSLSSLY